MYIQVMWLNEKTKCMYMHANSEDLLVMVIILENSKSKVQRYFKQQKNDISLLPRKEFDDSPKNNDYDTPAHIMQAT